MKAVVGTRLAVVLPLAVVCTAAAWTGLGLFGVRRWVRGVGAAGLASVFLPVDGAHWPVEPTLEFSAGIFVSILATSVAAAFLFDLLRNWIGPNGALAATAAFLATPVFFWAETSKYSSLSVCLVVMALWCYKEGARSSPLRTALAFCMVGLAVWNQMPFGLMLGFALAVVALAALRMGWKPAGQRAGAAVAGFAVGIIPFVLTLTLLHQAHMDSQFAPTGGGGTSTWIETQKQPGGLLALGAFAHPTSPFKALFATFVWTRWTELRYALPFPAIAPITGVALAAFALPRLRTGLPRFTFPFTLVYLAVVYVMMGIQFTNIGAGPDLRYGLTFWPLLAVLAAPTLADVAERRGLRWFAWAILYGLLGILLLTTALDLGAHAAHRNLTSHGVMFDQTGPLRYGGLALAAGLLLLFLAGQRIRFPWRDHAVAVALGIGAGAQVLLLCIDQGTGPWAAWPTALLAKFFGYILYRHWPQYGI